ncbi:hypothetical protein VPH35_051263 [Triticum aestivum]
MFPIHKPDIGHAVPVYWPGSGHTIPALKRMRQSSCFLWSHCSSPLVAPAALQANSAAPRRLLAPVAASSSGSASLHLPAAEPPPAAPTACRYAKYSGCAVAIQSPSYSVAQRRVAPPRQRHLRRGRSSSTPALLRRHAAGWGALPPPTRIRPQASAPGPYFDSWLSLHPPSPMTRSLLQQSHTGAPAPPCLPAAPAARLPPAASVRAAPPRPPAPPRVAPLLLSTDCGRVVVRLRPLHRLADSLRRPDHRFGSRTHSAP